MGEGEREGENSRKKAKTKEESNQIKSNQTKPNQTVRRTQVSALQLDSTAVDAVAVDSRKPHACARLLELLDRPVAGAGGVFRCNLRGRVGMVDSGVGGADVGCF